MDKMFFKIFVATLLISVSVYAQQMKIFSTDNAQMLPEIKGVVISENGKVIVGPIPSADQREKDYKELDLKTGDEIQFINGKRIKSIGDFKSNYSVINIGGEIKLGIKRGNERFIVSFKKSKELKPGGKIVSIQRGSADGNDVKIKNGKVIMNGKKLDLDSLKKSGAKVIIKKDTK